jgi:hypothetical protein
MRPNTPEHYSETAYRRSKLYRLEIFVLERKVYGKLYVCVRGKSRVMRSVLCWRFWQNLTLVAVKKF